LGRTIHRLKPTGISIGHMVVAFALEKNDLRDSSRQNILAER
jgi:hypothetical protein